jgi:hypothetical protein
LANLLNGVKKYFTILVQVFGNRLKKYLLLAFLYGGLGKIGK